MLKKSNELTEIKSKDNEKNFFIDIYNFVKNNNILFIFTIICVFMVVGSQLYNTNMRLDVQFYMMNPDYEYNWLEIGRFGAIFLKYLLTLNFFTPYFISGLFFLVLIITIVCFQFTIKKYTDKINFLLLLSIFLIFASPMFAEQFYFTIQYVEISFAMMLNIIAANEIFKYINTNKARYAIISIICMVIAFGTYQSFVPMYICLVTALYLLKSMNEQKTNVKDVICDFLKLIVTFLIGFIIYSVISNFFIKSDYLTQNILWGKEEVSTIIKNIIKYMKTVILGESFYNKSYLIMMILLFMTQIIIDFKKSFFVKFKNLCIVIVFLLTPFLLEIYVGQDSQIRSQLTLPVATALGFIIIRKLFISDFKK